jgi:hypothetical protein
MPRRVIRRPSTTATGITATAIRPHVIAVQPSAGVNMNPLMNTTKINTARIGTTTSTVIVTSAGRSRTRRSTMISITVVITQANAAKGRMCRKSSIRPPGRSDSPGPRR